MKLSNSISKRNLTFTVPIVILIAVFFIGYYFYYIPKNKADLHKNGFLILENIKENILTRNNDYQNLYKNYFDKFSGNTENIQTQLDSNNAVGMVISLTDFVAAKNGANTSKNFLGYDDVQDEFQAVNIEQKNILYLFKNIKYANGFLLPAENVLNPVFEAQKTELFGSYLLADKKNGLIYKDQDLSIGANIPIDSLVPNTSAIFASVRDIKIEDINYIMFSYPFQFGNDNVILCGFIKETQYNNELHEIPVSFVYPIVIAFLLILIFLPIIKFYAIGKDETIKFFDIILSVLSFIIGPALVTLILIQVLLLWAADLRAKSNLEILSRQIDSSFVSDLLSAYNQLDKLDSIVASKKDSILGKIQNGSNINISSQIINYYETHGNDPNLDYNFDRIFWIDSRGLQRIKGQVEKEEPIFTNVERRNYFRLFKNNRAYLLPGHPGLFFGFEPINSWVDGEFRIIISKESRLKKGFVVAIATKMPSVIETILPPGFGFCVIDDTGKVQLHSDMNRNLQENIIDKMTPVRSVREAIISRQASYFNDVKFYGKTNAVNITPIAKIPFSLITFYDKGYIVPVNMRIFTFALLFCILSFSFYFLVWIAFFRKHYYVNPMLYSPMDFLKWAIPQRNSSAFYSLGARFLIGYMVLLLAFMAISGLLGISNYVVLVLVIITPVNVVSSLFVISYSSKKIASDDSPELQRSERKARTSIFFQLGTSIVVYVYSRLFTFPIEYQFLIFQGILNITMWIYFSSKNKKIFPAPKSEKYLLRFAALSTALILCLAALPGALYTWYAHNQEITQSVKKAQLYLAESLQKRKPSVLKFMKNQDTLDVPSNYFERLQYQSGIYKIYKDSVDWKNDYMPVSDPGSYEQFYFGIANDIGNNYYDPLLFPALKDTASDKAWYWSRSGSKLYFIYALPDNSSAVSTNNAPVKPLRIISFFPARYKFVGVSFASLALVFVVILLIRGLYILLASLAERIFLKKFIDNNEGKIYNGNIMVELISEFKNTSGTADPEFDDEIKKLEKEYTYYIPASNNAAIYKQEKDIIDTNKKLRPFYDFIWKNCTEKEQYLLYDFAKDSLVNYKNIEPIYDLLEKGIFIIRNHEIKMLSASFRAYVLGKRNTPEIYNMEKKFQQNSTWQTFRVPILLILIGIAFFIFFTQQETFQKLTAIVAGISSMLSLLFKFVTDNSNSAATAKK